MAPGQGRMLSARGLRRSSSPMDFHARAPRRSRQSARQRRKEPPDEKAKPKPVCARQIPGGVDRLVAVPFDYEGPWHGYASDAATVRRGFPFSYYSPALMQAPAQPAADISASRSKQSAGAPSRSLIQTPSGAAFASEGPTSTSPCAGWVRRSFAIASMKSAWS